jgi:hypothetical protein
MRAAALSSEISRIMASVQSRFILGNEMKNQMMIAVTTLVTAHPNTIKRAQLSVNVCCVKFR